MSDEFNPYHRWLKIAISDAPPSHYELLGVTAFESDEERLREAYRARHLLVRQYEVGTYEDEALRLLDELSAAYYCLTNPREKQRYDDRLRRNSDRATVAESSPVVGTQAEGQVGRPEALSSGLDEVSSEGLASQEVPQCPSCQRATASRNTWSPVPVSIDRTEDLESPVCRIRFHRSRMRMAVSVDAQPLGWSESHHDAYWSRQAVTLAAAAVILVPMASCLVLQLVLGENFLAPIVALGLIAPVVVAAVWRLYVPEVASAEEAAWKLVVPRLLSRPRAWEHFGFITGLAEASTARLQTMSPGPNEATLPWADARLRRETAAKRAAALRQCLVQARRLASDGLVPGAAVGLLYRLAIADQLVLGGRRKELASLCRQLSEDCFGDGLPLQALDIALGGGRLVKYLGPEARVAILHSCVRLANWNGLTAGEVFGLATEAKSLWRLVAPLSPSVRRSLAFLVALERTCAEGLAPHGAFTVFELAHRGTAALFERANHGRLLELYRHADLLALIPDPPISLRISGFYYEDQRFVSKPRISVYETPEGPVLDLGGQRVRPRENPADVAGRIVPWSSLYFDKIVPWVEQELESEPSRERLDEVRGMRVTCPYCQEAFVHTDTGSVPPWDVPVDLPRIPMGNVAGVVLAASMALSIIAGVAAWLTGPPTEAPAGSDAMAAAVVGERMNESDRPQSSSGPEENLAEQTEERPDGTEPSSALTLGSPVQWTGSLARILAEPSSPLDGAAAPQGTVRVLVTSVDPSPGVDVRAFEAIVNDLCFAGQLVDYVAATDGPGGADRVTVEGSILDPAAKSDLAFDGLPIPRVQLVSVRKAGDPGTRAEVGRPRPFDDAPDAVESMTLVTQLRTATCHVQFTGRVEEVTRPPTGPPSLRVAIDGLDRSVVVRFSAGAVPPTAASIQAGDIVTVAATVTDQLALANSAAPPVRLPVLQGEDLTVDAPSSSAAGVEHERRRPVSQRETAVGPGAPGHGGSSGVALPAGDADGTGPRAGNAVDGDPGNGSRQQVGKIRGELIAFNVRVEERRQ